MQKSGRNKSILHWNYEGFMEGYLVKSLRATYVLGFLCQRDFWKELSGTKM